jgi:hypothetical protein
MNEILDSFDIEYTAANRTAGEVLPTIKLVSDDASIDITDQLSALSAQSRLIQKAKTQGDFGQGNMNMWYKVGVTQGATLSLFVNDVEEQQGSTKYLSWAIGGGLAAILGLVALKKFCTKKNEVKRTSKSM